MSIRQRPAIVLATTEQECTVFVGGQHAVIRYAQQFPKPRAERVFPGHLVALRAGEDGTEVVIWRWFDAVVLDDVGDSVEVWEPAHGTVRAQRRDPQRRYRPGTRAYLSAGLPGAQWWAAGPVVERAEDAEVELDDVERFFIDLGIWDSLSH